MAADDPTVITDWNAIAESTVTGDATKPPVEAILYMAFVHAAVYDAVVGIDGRYAPYRFHAHAPHRASAQAAAVAAAHKILVTYSPYAQAKLDSDYAASLAQLPDGKGKRRGVAFGTRVAENLIRLRDGDGRDAPILFTQRPGPGVWRPTPPMFAPMIDPLAGLRDAAAGPKPHPVRPTGTAKAHLGPLHPRLQRGEGAWLGRVDRPYPSPDRHRAVLLRPGQRPVPGHVRDQVSVRHLDLVDAARMFAAADMSAADTIISVWHAKYVDGFWRPSTAINLADTDGNPATDPDPSWVPLRPDPAYPEYPSGYNGFAAAVTRALENLFHTRRLQLTVTSTAVPGVQRHYDSGGALRRDVVDGRMWLGVHFRFADTAARDMGIRLADWTLDHYFQPLHGHGQAG
jgi:hypothetical protein